MKLQTEDLETFGIILERPSMFLLNKVEDYYLFFLGYTFLDKKELYTFIDKEFSKFVGKELSMNSEESKWFKMIRYYSSTDLNSVDLFSKLFISFIRKVSPDFLNG
jgi:hypothetical protein